MSNVQIVSIQARPEISFEDFWQAYPRRVARKDAMKAWKAVDKSAYPKILPAIVQQKLTDQWQKEEGKYIPYPATWLRGERWEDELGVDLSLGSCSWNVNGNRGGEARCTRPATMVKRGLGYCKEHGDRNT